MLGALHGDFLGRYQLDNICLDLADCSNFMLCKFLPFPVHRNAVLTHKLPTITTVAFCVSIFALFTAWFVGNSDFLKDISHLKQMVDVESRRQAGRTLLGQPGLPPTVGAGGGEVFSITEHQPAQAVLTEHMQTGEDSRVGVVVQTDGACELLRQLLESFLCHLVRLSHFQ